MRRGGNGISLLEYRRRRLLTKRPVIGEEGENQHRPQHCTAHQFKKDIKILYTVR
jgi:hypothetical protein